MDVYVVHYGEIALKGKNRGYFERTLIRNMDSALKKLGDVDRKIRRGYGRIVIEDPAPDIGGILEFIPGIKYFSRAKEVDLSIDDIKGVALQLAEAEEGAASFKIDARRVDKSFPMTSMEVNSVVGEYVLRSTGKAVSLENPDLTIYIEICENKAYVYREKRYGVGGLPVGTSGKVISLISGGIDSPVAAFMMMKRGCRVVLLHFFNETLHSRQVRQKIEMLGEALTRFQSRIELYVIPFGELQKEIIGLVPSKYRMLIYRRAMMRIASGIADIEGAKAIVTGDSLGQVASQTLDNLNVIYSAASYPVLSPLIGLDKDEVTKTARGIGTYDVSIMPYEDCCSFMVAEHPETRGKIEVVEELERNMKLEVKDAVRRAEIMRFGKK
ncbi:MAG: tRNA uracil 4-sulfurtransferase ThiI [bacterium]